MQALQERCVGPRESPTVDWSESILPDSALPLSADELWRVLGDLDDDRLALLGTRLMVLAVKQDYFPRSVWALIGEKLRVDAIARQALSEANLAARKAQMAVEKFDGLYALIRSLEQRVDSLTPGVGTE